MIDCPTASALQHFLADQTNYPALQKIATFNTIDDIRASFLEHGIDFEKCDHKQAMKVVHNYLSQITDDDLLQAQGGEKVVKITVTGIAAAAGIAAGAAVAGGVAVGGAVATGVLLS